MCFSEFVYFFKKSLLRFCLGPESLQKVYDLLRSFTTIIARPCIACILHHFAIYFFSTFDPESPVEYFVCNSFSFFFFFPRATFARSCGFSKDSAAYIDSTPDDIYVRCSLHSSILNRLPVQPKSWSCHRSRRSIPAVLLTSPGTTITRPNDRYCPATNSPLSACRQPPRASPGPPTTIRP